MSLKDHGEDKAVAPQPRELVNLIAVTEDLLKALSRKDRARASALADEESACWTKANVLMLRLASEGGHGDLLVELVAAMNAAGQAHGRAMFLINNLGSTRG